jgi:uncharacterized membrane protein YgcG
MLLLFVALVDPETVPTINLLITLAGFAAAAGAHATAVRNLNGQLTDLQRRMDAAEQTGTTYSRQTRWMTEQNSVQIADLIVTQKAQINAIHEIKTDVRLTAEWVAEQKQKCKD